MADGEPRSLPLLQHCECDFEQAGALVNLQVVELQGGSPLAALPHLPEDVLKKIDKLVELKYYTSRADFPKGDNQTSKE